MTMVCSLVLWKCRDIPHLRIIVLSIICCQWYILLALEFSAAKLQTVVGRVARYKVDVNVRLWNMIMTLLGTLELDGSEYNLLSVNDPNSQKFIFNEQAQYVDPDPGHSFPAMRDQIFGSDDTSANPAPMNAFAQNVMSGFNPGLVAVHKTRVSEFAVFDGRFASVPAASNQPNCICVHSGPSARATSNVALLAKGYPQRTIFENLDDAGIDFGIYYQNIPVTLFYRNLRKLRYVTKFHPYDLSFKRDASKGKLAGYVVVEQRYVDTKLIHDVQQGQKDETAVEPDPFGDHLR
ncbi:hypothetical protein L6164_031286 [Bauhinia variegata]|uniref:Uncharacterized protein n=1 Tax=Bauhinia variegata TaxID=167791 RepID=A0ACB9LEH7_BAUVA|nr:hypothetical protein L6164_031286 [Bauhinia variegata]